ncbi:ZSC20-like protein [Mya arenaria]|uniref:ZSC20-like protein n=1 Tax=Mya arenaria TaxID=6604 RepID=A0ABY7F7G8_MYAAR|nr:ZSC20-like protein [Mya arenaria]
MVFVMICALKKLLFIISASKKLYSCQFCGRNFPAPSKLAGHIRIHTGEKPYKCSTCGRDFTHKHSMLNHMYNVHGQVVKVNKE